LDIVRFIAGRSEASKNSFKYVSGPLPVVRRWKDRKDAWAMETRRQAKHFSFLDFEFGL
jgi:hypothetical protein